MGTSDVALDVMYGLTSKVLELGGASMPTS